MKLADIWVKISAKNEGLKAALSEAEDVSRKTAKRLEDSSKAVMKAVGVAAAAASAAIAAIGVKSIESAANSAALQAQFEQVFGDIQNKAQEVVEGLGDDFGMLPNRLKPAFSSMTSMFKGLGYDTEEAMGMAKDAVTMAADAAAFFDKSYEDANAALNSFLKGNYEGGEAIGLFGNETQIAAFAAEKLGISWKDAGEAQKQLARLEYAKAMQEAAGVTGQAAREADNYQNQLGNLKQGWADFLAVVGQPLLEPAVNALKLLAEHLTTLRDLIASEGLAGAIEKIFPDWLEGTIFAIAGALTAAMIPAIIALKAPLIAAAAAGWAAVAPLLPFLAIGAAIGALAYVIIKNWEPIKDFFINLWDGITSTATACWDALKDGIKVFTDTVTETWEGFKKKTSEIWDSIKQFLVDWWPYLLGALTGPIGLVAAAIYDNWDAIKQFTIDIWTSISTWLSNLWTNIENTVKTAWNNIYKHLSGIWKNISDGFDGLVKKALNWGKNLMGEFISGFMSRFEDLKAALRSAADAVAGFLGFHSPTKLGPGRDADKWAPNLVKMLADGLKDNLPVLQASVNALAQAMDIGNMKLSIASVNSITPANLGTTITNYNTSRTEGPTITVQLQPGAVQIRSDNPRDILDGLMRELSKRGVRF